MRFDEGRSKYYKFYFICVYVRSVDNLTEYIDTVVQ